MRREYCCSPSRNSSYSDSPTHLEGKERKIIQETNAYNVSQICGLLVDNNMAMLNSVSKQSVCTILLLDYCIIAEVGDQPTFAIIYIHYVIVEAEFEIRQDK